MRKLAHSYIAKHMYTYDVGYRTKNNKSITWDRQLIRVMILQDESRVGLYLEWSRECIYNLFYVLNPRTYVESL